MSETMKKILLLFLALIISTTAFAAPLDLLHTQIGKALNLPTCAVNPLEKNVAEPCYLSMGHHDIVNLAIGAPTTGEMVIIAYPPTQASTISATSWFFAVLDEQRIMRMATILTQATPAANQRLAFEFTEHFGEPLPTDEQQQYWVSHLLQVFTTVEEIDNPVITIWKNHEQTAILCYDPNYESKGMAAIIDHSATQHKQP